MSYIKKENGLVVNTDLNEYERYKLKREQALRDKSLIEKVNMLEKEVKQLKEIIGKMNGS